MVVAAARPYRRSAYVMATRACGLHCTVFGNGVCNSAGGIVIGDRELVSIDPAALRPQDPVQCLGFLFCALKIIVGLPPCATNLKTLSLMIVP